MSKLFTFDKTIDAGEKFYLKDIISDVDYKEWFSMSDNPKIFILNKGRCGNGGTTGFINYAKKHSKGIYIMVPNVSIAMSKELDNEICCVYGGATGTDENKPVKVATWDSGLNIIKHYQECGLAGEDVFDNKTWKNSLLVVDEYHKIVEDSSFREVCAKIIETVIKTKLNVVMMSATPDYELVEMLKEVSGKEVITVNVEYDKYEMEKKPILFLDNYKTYTKHTSKRGNIYYTTKDTIKNIIGIVTKAKQPDEHICVFYNSVENCYKIISSSVFKDDMEILCSSTNKEDDIGRYYSGSFDESKHIHFLTSAYFTGMDINTKIEKVIIIGGNNTECLAYTASTIKQITGRMRAGYESLFVIKENNGSADNTKIGFLEAEKEKNKDMWDAWPNESRTKSCFIEVFLKYARTEQTINAMKGWDNIKSFKEMMSIFKEYSVIKAEYDQIKKNIKKARETSFQQYKEKRMNNEFVDYKYSYRCEKFIEMNGIERFEFARIRDISQWWKMFKKVNGLDVENMTQDELWKTFLGNGIYKFEYLADLVSFLPHTGTSIYDTELLHIISEMFGCTCGWFEGNLNRKNELQCICLRL